jgi:hypothetical protein
MCNRLVEELAHATRTHLQAVSALERAVQNDQIEYIYSIERKLAAARRRKVRARYQYRKHRAVHTRQRNLLRMLGHRN